MSRREEIKQKETFQLKFQQSIQQTNQKITSWLKPTGVPSKSTSLQNLPIIQQGKGLNSTDPITGNIEEFLKDDSASSKHGVSSKVQNSAMNSLMNKMRTEKRNNLIKQGKITKSGKSVKPQTRPQPHKPQPKAFVNNSDSDSEDDSSHKEITGKKPKLLF